MKRNVLVTGATGFLGSNLVYRLLKRGDHVHLLVRNGTGEAWRRLEAVLKVIDPGFVLGSYDCTVVPGDLTLPGCGAGREQTARLKGCIDEIWHSAASVSFSFREAAATREVNVVGTKNLLDFAADLGTPDLHHVSTAYVAGFHKGCFRETDDGTGKVSKNPYEKTKQEGEQLVRGYGGRYSIYRPSIIVGDSRNGTTPNFTGYYKVFQWFYLIRIQLARRIEYQQSMCQSSGIRINSKGILSLPIIVPCDPGTTTNLVPVDWVADTMLRLSESRPTGKSFHLTHPEPVPFRWLLETSCRILRLGEIKIAEPAMAHTLLAYPGMAHESRLLQDVQRQLNDWLMMYLPYMWGEPTFDTMNVRQSLKTAYTPPRPIDEDFLTILLDYAVANRFKQNGAAQPSNN